MSLCKECDIKPICNIYSDIAKHMVHASITIDSCDFNNNHMMRTKEKELKPKVEIDPFTGKPKVDRDRINELSNKNRKEKMKQQEKAAKVKAEPKTTFVAEPLVLDHTCGGCGASTFKEDAAKCSTCGKDICSCCATVDGDTKNLLCPECWQAL